MPLRRMTAARGAALVLVAVLTACTTSKPAPPPPEAPTCPACPVCPAPEKPVAKKETRYTPVEFSALPGWPGDLVASWPAWLASCKRVGSRDGWQGLCTQAKSVDAQDAAAMRAYFEANFSPLQIASVTANEPPDDTGLVTGYYEPLLTGGRDWKQGRVPLYGVPDDLLTIELAGLYPELKGMRLRGRVDGNRVVPYWNRTEIDAGKLEGKSAVLVWVDDAVDAFFLQIQGSGRVKLDDGSIVRVGYAEQNGHPYKAIGKWLAERGEMTMDQVSMQNIRAWGRKNPDRLPELLAQNPSFVFFRVTPANDEGPHGALAVPLTGGASIAVDRKHIPLGTPVWLSASRPDDGKPLQRLMHAQDTGGAIRGAVRADFFWGFGDEAGALAGKTKQEGRLWLLWPKGLAAPKAE